MPAPGYRLRADLVAGGAAEIEAIDRPLVVRGDTTLASDLGIADAGTDDVYAAMDWLLAQKGKIEKKLAGGIFPRRDRDV